MFLLIPPDARRAVASIWWDTLGMRATRSDFMTLEDCFVPDEALLLRTEDVLLFRRDGANWFWGSYTPVYLGVGVAAYRAISETVKGRTPPGFTQLLAYHPDVRRQVGEMSVDRGRAPPDALRGLARGHAGPDRRRRRRCTGLVLRGARRSPESRGRP